MVCRASGTNPEVSQAQWPISHDKEFPQQYHARKCKAHIKMKGHWHVVDWQGGSQPQLTPPDLHLSSPYACQWPDVTMIPDHIIQQNLILKWLVRFYEAAGPLTVAAQAWRTTPWPVLRGRSCHATGHPNLVGARTVKVSTWAGMIGDFEKHLAISVKWWPLISSDQYIDIKRLKKI